MGNFLQFCKVLEQRKSSAQVDLSKSSVWRVGFIYERPFQLRSATQEYSGSGKPVLCEKSLLLFPFL